MSFWKRSADSAHPPDHLDEGKSASGDWMFDTYRDQIIDLLYRVDEALDRRDKRIVQFIATSPGEGATSMAWGYARASAAILGRRVLLLSDSADVPALCEKDGVAGSAESGDGIIRDAGKGLHISRLAGDGGFAREAAAGKFDADLWTTLRREFDEIVVDSPALSGSHLGRLIAGSADGVIIVVEAEKTRDPVARKLIDDLQSVRANIIGSVLNKRKFYVPAAIYRHL